MSVTRKACDGSVTLFQVCRIYFLYSNYCLLLTCLFTLNIRLPNVEGCVFITYQSLFGFAFEFFYRTRTSIFSFQCSSEVFHTQNFRYITPSPLFREVRYVGGRAASRQAIRSDGQNSVYEPPPCVNPTLQRHA